MTAGRGGNPTSFKHGGKGERDIHSDSRESDIIQTWTGESDISETRAKNQPSFENWTSLKQGVSVAMVALRHSRIFEWYFKQFVRIPMFRIRLSEYLLSGGA